MNDQPYFDQFAQALRDNDRSPLTVQSYVEDAGRFAKWFEETNGEAFAPIHITPTDIREYRNHLLNALRLRPNTVNRRLSGIAAFCRWAQQQNLIPADPSASIKQIGQTRTAPRWLERKQQFALQRAIEAHLAQAAHSTRSARSARYARKRAFWHQRDAYLVIFLMHTGLRVAEAKALDVDDLTMGERSGTVTVRGKGNKVRQVPLNLEARRAAREWLTLRGELGGGRAVFISQSGKRLTARSIQRIVWELGRRAKIESLTPHVLRHTFAKRLGESGVGIDRIATLMGHTSIDTTRIYMTPSLTELARDVDGLVER